MGGKATIDGEGIAQHEKSITQQDTIADKHDKKVEDGA